MTAAPAISILLPTYNGERYLAAQLDSILAQSWQDFELVAVDDGSSDGTAALLAGYAARDPRIRLLPSDGNRGQKVRLSELVAAAHAPLLSFADQDDTWHPERTARLAAALGERNLAVGRSELTDATGTPLNLSLTEQFGPPNHESERLTLLFIPRGISGHAMLARRETVTEAAFARPQPFDLLIGLDAAFSKGIAYAQDAIVYHRIHGANQCNGGVARTLPFYRRVTPGRVYAALQLVRSARWGLVARLEHLGNSPVLAPDARAALARLARLCREAWFDVHAARPAPPRLLDTILEGFRPFAGSDGDWRFAERQLRHLARPQAHPVNLWASARHMVAAEKALVF